MQRPNLVNDKYTALLRSGLYVPATVKAKMVELQQAGWSFWAVDQSRGRCYHGSKIITIPVWAMKRENSKFVQYICHEMAHAFVGWKVASHGTEFMRMLASICPADCLIHEATYKPQNFIRSGVQLDAAHVGF